ncbi:MAG: SDR family oxidoreductase [Bacilli bacterium]
MPNQPKPVLPKQHQDGQPGLEHLMTPAPKFDRDDYKGAEKLKDKVAIITGGDSGIGRSVAVLYAKEGADVVIAYLDEHEDAKATQAYIEKLGRRCHLIPGDLGVAAHCDDVVRQTVETFGAVDILVNNIAVQYPVYDFSELTEAQIERTFRVNIFSFYFMTRAVLPHFKAGSTIINTASVTAYEGHDSLLDYSATKGAVVTFTRSVAKHLADKGIRVNGVAPGPIWTPLIPASFSAEKVEVFGSDTPLGRPGQPIDCAPAYVYLACADSAYVTGQMIHVNGGISVSG